MHIFPNIKFDATTIAISQPCYQCFDITAAAMLLAPNQNNQNGLSNVSLAVVVVKIFMRLHLALTVFKN